MASDFQHSVHTTKSIDEAVDALTTTLKDHQFGVLWQMDIPQKLQEKGVDFNLPYRVLEVCNPREAKQVLTTNPTVGYFLPCKVVVYDDNGQTCIGLPRPTVLMGMMGDMRLLETAERVEGSLKAAIEEAVRL